VPRVLTDHHCRGSSSAFWRFGVREEDERGPGKGFEQTMLELDSDRFSLAGTDLSFWDRAATIYGVLEKGR
jgi:hypothetical protein